MIEKVLRDYLLERLNVPVYLEIPKKGAPDTYVVFEKTGGGITNHIRSSTFAFQSVAPSLSQASALNDEVIAAMEEALELPEIARSQLNSDYNFTDPEKKYYRYQAVFDLVHY